MGRKKKESPLALLRQQFNEFKRGGGVAAPPSLDTVSCYVCGRRAHRKNLKYIGKGKDGEDVYRDESCEAGSSSWFRNMPNSSVRKYFTDPNDPDLSGK